MNDTPKPPTTSTASGVAWYFNTSLVQVLLILLFPIGFTLMWLGRVFSARTRWIVTGFLGLFIVSLMSTKAPQKGADLAVSPNVVSSPASPGVALVAEKPALIDEALLAAIRASNKDQVAAILDQAPALVKSADKSGFTPLHAAAVFTTDDGAIIRLLVARGADLHAIRDPGSTPLWWAVNTPAKVAVLLELGSKPDFHGPLCDTPLMTAAERGHVETMILLLDHGADVNFADIYGRTALHAAAKNGRFAATELLLARGANVNARCKTNTYEPEPLHTPLALALKGGRREVAMLIERNGGTE